MSVGFLRDSFSSQKLKKLKRELTVCENKDPYKDKPTSYKVYEETDKEIYIPLGQWQQYFSKFPYLLSDYDKIDVKFIYNLYTKDTDHRKRDQDVVVKQALRKLNSHHSVLIAPFTGFGKTSISIYLMTKLKLKTAIVCFSTVIRNQWCKEIDKFTGGKCKVQMVDKHLDPDADVYIFGAVKSPRREDLVDIGLVIVDEIHMSSVRIFTSVLLKFTPLYLIGLSATPDRKDGLHRLFNLYFGPRKNFIVRKEVKNFEVIKYKTSYTPEIEYIVVRGRVIPNWNKIISSIEEKPERHQEIADIAINHPEEKIIILCNRVVQTKGIYDILCSEGESVDILCGTKKKWDKECRILVAGIKKGGTGLDDPSLTMMILASDMTDARQCEGRIRTTNNIVYDIVDNFKSFEKHWNMREKWYISRGADIKYMNPHENILEQRIEKQGIRKKSYNKSENTKSYGGASRFFLDK